MRTASQSSHRWCVLLTPVVSLSLLVFKHRNTTSREQDKTHTPPGRKGLWAWHRGLVRYLPGTARSDRSAPERTERKSSCSRWAKNQWFLIQSNSLANGSRDPGLPSWRKKGFWKSFWSQILGSQIDPANWRQVRPPVWGSTHQNALFFHCF